MAVRLSALRTGRAVLPTNIIFLLLVLISVGCRVNPQGLVRLEGLGKFKNKFIHLIGSRTRDLPACSIVPQQLSYRVPRWRKQEPQKISKYLSHYTA
jgi:hypothetical protein